jgi:hypothetical protein
MTLMQKVVSMLLEEDCAMGLGEFAGVLGYKKWQIEGVMLTLIVMGWVVCINGKYRKLRQR